MRAHHIIMIFFAAVIAPCLFLSLRLTGAEESDRARRRMDKSFQAACDDTARDIIGFYAGEPVPECGRAYGEFLKNLAVRLGIADDPAAREELFRYVPCVIVTCEKGVWLSKLSKDGTGGTFTVTGRMIGGDREEALKTAVKEGLEGVSEDCRLEVLPDELVIPEYGEGQKSVLYTSNFSHALTGPSVIALFIGYPADGLSGSYSSAAVSGSYYKEAEGYYITEERSGLLYHAEGSDCLIGKEALRVSSALEAAEHGAHACGRCFYNGTVAASDMPVSGR